MDSGSVNPSDCTVYDRTGSARSQRKQVPIVSSSIRSVWWKASKAVYLILTSSLSLDEVKSRQRLIPMGHGVAFIHPFHRFAKACGSWNQTNRRFVTIRCSSPL